MADNWLLYLKAYATDNDVDSKRVLELRAGLDLGIILLQLLQR